MQQTILAQGLAELGFEPEAAAALERKLDAYVRELEMFNAAYDLCGADTRDDIVVKHVLDSLSAANRVKKIADAVQAEAGRSALIADVGSGGGLPGIPLAAALSGHRFVLIERMSKRCAFLENCIAILGLTNVSVENTEAERVFPETADIAVFRAFRPLDKKMIRTLLRIVKPGGILAAYKAKRENITAEMAGIADIVPEYGVEQLTVPFMPQHERNLVIIGKRP